ncbi:ATP-dependent helicase HrpB [Deinococcus irradiatisoli]|uniref:ATP-dependent helicase HrpB n=1 Tax=Deinococcus irradiatisoli TaxID=2202254 RepID=A0A2Z3JH20_9DEIO|nr:ATP-dependent helicase HrpB [Deinococcus irradiatisoli]AWN24477.1 ATP-dependent helicase HrpB [Deinococcus irradiatisoli]
MSLPVLELLPQLKAALAAHPLTLLQAPPGAGKSTGLPLELLHEPWLAGQRLLLLQPRRVAARAVAARLAASLGEKVGQTVGLRVRFETNVSAATRLEVVTEGILTRRLQHDPELLGPQWGAVGLVIFDEFHERSLNADLSLALVREVQGALRGDLRVLIMSATLDPSLPERLGGGVPIIESRGRSFPVEVRYLAADPADPSAAVTGAVLRALDEESGDVLAFLPGVAEIRRSLAALRGWRPDVAVLPLYGDLPIAEQNRAIAPDPLRRKVVLATSIAETSLTIDGVRVVVDSGLTRTQQFDPGSGLSRLVTVRVTRDSADQRAGRAGRTAPGVAYRLWSERTQPLLTAARAPEILGADLAPLVLEVAGWGAQVPDLPWLDAPPAMRVTAAQTLLSDLEALREGQITTQGRALLDLPTHPRLAHLLSGGAQLGLGALAADVAALLEERDPLPRGSGSDLTRRVSALRAHRAGQRIEGDAAVLDRAERLSQQWRRLLRLPADDRAPAPEQVGQLLFLAYPERAGQLRAGSTDRYLLAGGQGARLPEADDLASEPYLVAAHLDAGSGEGRIYLAAPLDPAVLEAQAEVSDTVAWDSRSGSLTAARERRYGRLLLGSQPLTRVPEALRLEAVRAAVQREGLESLAWTDEARQWQARVLSLRCWRGEEWPDVSDAALLSRLDDWLTPHLGGVRRREDLGRIHLLPALQSLLPWPLPRQLDELAPTHLGVPSGHSVKLTYRPDGEAPILAVKLQELFGLADTPSVNAGRTPVLLHLLSPARRPVQITQDLRSFWNGGYFEVRKDLRGQYPKHPWPDDPWSAVPTRATKKRMER